MIKVPWNTTPFAYPLAQYGLWKPPPPRERSHQKRSNKLTWAKVVKGKPDTSKSKDQSES